MQGSAGSPGTEAGGGQALLSVKIKRAYEPLAADDGARVLVDRIWPRGVSKERLHADAWLRELGPSTELRRWFGHDAARWEEFQRRYREELAGADRQTPLAELVERARQGPLTLVYSARDTEHNQAVVLRDVLLDRLHEGSARP